MASWPVIRAMVEFQVTVLPGSEGFCVLQTALKPLLIHLFPHEALPPVVASASEEFTVYLIG